MAKNLKTTLFMKSFSNKSRANRRIQVVKTIALKLQAQNFLTFEVTSSQGVRPEETDVTGQADEHKYHYLDNNHGSQLRQSSCLKVVSLEFFYIFRGSCRF